MSKDKNLNNMDEQNIEKDINLETTKINDEDFTFLDNEEVNEENNKEDKNQKNKSKNNVKSIAILAIVGALCLGVGYTTGKSAGRQLPATHKSYSESKVIATVGDSKITEGNLEKRMLPLFFINGKEEMTAEEIKAHEESMIDYMTTTEVLYLEGKKDKIEATEEDVENEYTALMASIGQKFGLLEEDFINRFNISKEEIKVDLEKEIIAMKYIEKASSVSDEEAKNYYEKNTDEFLKVRASHILIPNTDDAGQPLSEDKLKENKELAEDLLKRAQGGEDFESLAKEYSKDGSAASGGDLDFFGKGQMVEKFETAAFSLKVGEVSNDVVETQFGYHIIKKTDEKNDEFETVKEELKYRLSYEKQTNVVDDLVEKYNVEVKGK